MSRLGPPLALALALAAPAHAFAPHDDGATGLHDQRVRDAEPHQQAALARSKVWRTFTAGEGQGWRARFDERTGTPIRMWGAPIDLGPVATEGQVTTALLDFVDRHAHLLGADASRLRLRSASYVPRLDTWYVQLDALVDGIPVLGGGVTARIAHGDLVMLGAETYPGLDLPGVKLTRSDAAARAIDLGPAPQAVHRDVHTDLVAVPRMREGVLELRPAWRTTSHTEQPVGQWETFVDAADGRFLGARNNVRYAQGTVLAEHDVRTVNGDTTISPVPWVEISDGVQTINSDGQGTFSLDGSGFTARLSSPYYSVFNEAGPEGELQFDGGEAVFSDDDATWAERDTYVFLGHVHEWSERVAPEVPASVNAHVNIDESCNAYYDGDVNLFQAGNGCNNTGRIADVVYHEWGHGFHFNSIEAGDYDGSLGEGAADVVAFLQTGDPVIAPYFTTNGQGIRNVSPDRVYPDDYQPSQQYVHSNGLIFGGAMWDLWGMLVDEYGAEQGTAVIEDIFAGLLKGGPTIENSFDEALFADDDDGDLANGTPHECLILEAFGAHGLGPLGKGTTFLAFHESDVDARPGEPTWLEVDLVPASERCFPFAPEAATVHYRVNGGDWQTTLLDLEEDRATGVIPAQALGDFVEYYVEVEDGDGGSVTAPDGGIIHPFTYHVGDVLPVYCDDFETGDGGFTHELVNGQETEGADDWMWATPRGLAGDPEQAFSGRYVWGNDLGGRQYNGEYQNNKFNRLTSPSLDTRHYQGVFLHYMRWLTVEDGAYDRARIRADGEVVWENWANEQTRTDHHIDRQWMAHAVDLEGRADQGSVEIAWELESDEGLPFGGWNIDDVCLFAPDTPDNRLGVADFVARADGDGGIEVSFTNPLHDPVERVVVVRKNRGWPAGPDQGKVVHEATEPTLGETVSFVDDDVTKHGNYYYAVYATDGTHWLSWTVPGLNASLASADGNPEDLGLCGCATGTSLPATAPAWLLVALLGLRRRQ